MWEGCLGRVCGTNKHLNTVHQCCYDLDFLSAELTQTDNTATSSLGSICTLHVPQWHKWYLLPKITITQPAMKTTHLNTMLLTIQMRFWIFPNLGIRSCCTTLFLFGIISQCQASSHCWSTALFDWWNVVILENPLGWATAVYQSSQRALICEITSFPDLDTQAAANPDNMFSGYAASLRSKTDNVSKRDVSAAQQT